jgi:protein tyrosine phosphatase (PTP) superfamily phosphohydrolase (DUF442 family)
MPLDISKITEYLYIAALPRSQYAEDIRNKNIRLIINMIHHPPARVYKEQPFRLLTLRTFDSFLFPIPVKKLIKGVVTALPVINNNQAVLIYCRGGRHRSVAMGSAVLIAMGFHAEDAIQLISSQREAADPYAAHIRNQIRKFENVWSTT